ncbi:uncharacterized protein LOC115891783 [Sitophilus oryzae]|uniref:Uncharacterized protein LOC115891783 n=1 Tax=Sitophilus oryzae TaxID=7048 RepID=A0A6J2YVQ3_SITOR|nr:uncharacterized protein LOC115891783 [Sitophilus oryzae]
MQEIFLFICVLGLAKYSVCEIYTPIFFNEEEVRHVREVPKEKPPCKEAALVKILADCQVISPESIVDIAITDFDSACKIVSTQTRKVEKLYKNCTASGLYMYLINGLLSFDEKLCKSNEFYNEYDRYDNFQSLTN